MYFLIFVFCILPSLIYAFPSEEEMDCVINQIIEDCKGMTILKCIDDGSCEGTLKNNYEVKVYLTKWIQEFEDQAILVHSSYTPLVCTKNYNTQDHSFKVDSAYNPLWDGQKILCTPEITNVTNNWTVFGLNIISKGGLTIVGITGFSIGSIITFIVIDIKKKRVSIKNHTLVVQKNSK